MSQHFIGLDLGSHSVKAVVVEQRLRDAKVLRTDFEPVKLNEEGMVTEDAVGDAAQTLLARVHDDDATVFCALSGEGVSMHRFSLPISASKRAREILSFELDEVLPYDIEDAVFDYVELGRSDTVSYLVCCTQAERVERMLAQLNQRGIEPESISVAPVACGQYVKESNLLGEAPGTVAVVDLGHRRTNVSVLDGENVVTRTVIRGGRDLDVKLSQSAHGTIEQAQRHKEEYGLQGQGAEILKTALLPIVNELKQTFNSHMVNGGSPVAQVRICGGLANMLGIDTFLQDQLQTPVTVISVSESDVAPLDANMAPTNMVLATCLARLHLIGHTKRIDFRVEQFALTSNSDMLRRKIFMLAACVVAVLSAWTFSVWAQKSTLGVMDKAKEEQLAHLTKSKFGIRMTSRTLLEKAIQPTDSKANLIPTHDAFDIMLELSKRIPDSVVHDIERLDIKPGHIEIRGIVDSELTQTANTDEEDMELSPTDLIKQELAGFENCFTGFRIPKVQNTGMRQKYTLEIDSKCP